MHMLYKSILSKFPQRNLRLAFAYGSGVFQQRGHEDMKKNMIDFIFAVDDPAVWHKQNLSMNKKHYSFVRLAGCNNICKLQDNVGASIYFNTLVPCEGRIIKYGVISTESLLRDLLNWETLYVSGRLHKPVYNIITDVDEKLKGALRINLESAMHTALLLLPDCFTEFEFYSTIAGLSYTGDFRMTLGEDKNKVRNIVEPNIDQFRKLYGHLLEQDPYVQYSLNDTEIEQSLCSQSRLHHLNRLPSRIQHELTAQRNRDKRYRDTEEVLRTYSRDMEYEDALRKSIEAIVKQSSWTQSLKGILTAGFVKSVRYSGKKLKKMWKSRK